MPTIALTAADKVVYELVGYVSRNSAHRGYALRHEILALQHYAAPNSVTDSLMKLIAAGVLCCYHARDGVRLATAHDRGLTCDALGRVIVVSIPANEARS